METDCTVSKVLHHPSSRNCKEQKDLARGRDWFITCTTRTGLNKYTNTSTCRASYRLKASGAEGLPTILRTNHLQKPPHVKKPIYEQNSKPKFNEIIVCSFNKIKNSLTWNRAYHSYCARAPNRPHLWPPYFLFSFLSYCTKSLPPF